MLYTQYFVSLLTLLIFWRFLAILLNLDSANRSKRVFAFRKWATGPHLALRKLIDGKAARKFAAMSDSGRRSFKRNREWQLQSESLPSQVQRRQKETLRREAYQPLDTNSINLDATPLAAKMLMLSVAAAGLYHCLEVTTSWGFALYNYLAIATFYVAAHITVTRLVLRESRFWWWRPWPLLHHVYVKGLFSKRYEKALYVLLLPINPLLLPAGFFLFFFVKRIEQQYPLFYYRRTSLYRLGAFGMVVLHLFLEFFFDNIWIITTPIWAVFECIRISVRFVKKCLKTIGVDTEKIHYRFKRKLSEYSWF